MTGATGFVGGRLAEALATDGVAVRALVQLMARHRRSGTAADEAADPDAVARERVREPAADEARRPCHERLHSGDTAIA